MAAKSEAARAGSAIADAGAHVGRTLELAASQPPGQRELAWDAVLVRAALVEAVSPAGRGRERGGGQGYPRGAVKQRVV